MRAIDTEIKIGATPEQVWRVLTDTPQFPAWNPFITSIEGDLKVKGRLSLRIEPPDGKPMVFKPVVQEVEPEKKLSWHGQLFFPGLFDGRHEFIINEIATDVTSFIHREEFSGLLIPLMWSSVEKSTRSGFVLMNQALKKRVEAIEGKDPTG
jgi:hypothetical protein